MALPKRKRGEQAPEVDLTQPDEFISASQRAYKLVLENRRALVVGAAAIGVAVLGVIIGRELMFRGAASRSDAFARAVEVLGAEVKAPEPEPPPDAAVEAAPVGDEQPADKAGEDEAKTYASTVARAEAALDQLNKVEGGDVGRLAILGRATALLDAGKPQEAAAAYREFLASGLSEDYAFFGHDGLATALADAGDLDGALAEVEKVATLAGKAFADHAAYRKGRLLEAKGDRDGAANAYKALVAGHPDSVLKPRAEKRLGLLGS